MTIRVSGITEAIRFPPTARGTSVREILLVARRFTTKNTSAGPQKCPLKKSNHFIPKPRSLARLWTSSEGSGFPSLGFAGDRFSAGMGAGGVCSGSGIAAEILGRVSEAAGAGAFFTARTLTIRADLAELELDGSGEIGLVVPVGASVVSPFGFKNSSFFFFMKKK